MDHGAVAEEGRIPVEVKRAEEALYVETGWLAGVGEGWRALVGVGRGWSGLVGVTVLSFTELC